MQSEGLGVGFDFLNMQGRKKAAMLWRTSEDEE
jgi:hypothetical protein